MDSRAEHESLSLSAALSAFALTKALGVFPNSGWRVGNAEKILKSRGFSDFGSSAFVRKKALGASYE